MASSLCPGREKRMMRESEVQIDNSGYSAQVAKYKIKISRCYSEVWHVQTFEHRFSSILGRTYGCSGGRQ